MVVGPSHVLPASVEKQQPIFSRDQAPDLKHFPRNKGGGGIILRIIKYTMN
jgi:hypothetical protein